ncbi:MAG: membrane protein insertion efficiency factor YidD [Cellvibrionaceae bacterium]|nr:membrane protein insertion efficiency factor YidD [Cellvibrionaceae bacterium]
MDTGCKKGHQVKTLSARLCRRALLLPIKFYRYFISPLLGPRCRFEPSCSRFAEQAITEHGVVTGTWLTVKRLSRCHPWGGCGYDPVPTKKSKTS